MLIGSVPYAGSTNRITPAVSAIVPTLSNQSQLAYQQDKWLSKDSSFIQARETLSSDIDSVKIEVRPDEKKTLEQVSQLIINYNAMHSRLKESGGYLNPSVKSRMQPYLQIPMKGLLLDSTF